MRLIHPRLPRSNQGLTLIELLVAMAIGLILITGLMTLVVSNMRGFGELNKAGYQGESARYASQFLRDELGMSGYYGNLTFPRSRQDFPDDPCLTGADDIASRFDIFMQGLDDVDATTAAKFECQTGMAVAPGSDMLLLRRVSSVAVSPNNRQDSAVYLASNSTSFNIVQGQESVASISYITDSRFNTLRQLLERILYVSRCSVCSGDGADSIPTLKMVELENGDWSDPIPLVEGVEQMQIEYGIDTDENGYPDKWTHLPADRGEWELVAAVRFNLLMRNTEETQGYSDAKVYTLGLNDADQPLEVGPFADTFKRHVYSLTVRVRNAAERREEE